MGQGGGEETSGRARELTEMLRRYLLTHSRGLFAEHDDLIQQTLEDYYRTRDRSADTQPVETELPLLIAIARRRVADRYRQFSRRAIVDHPLDDYAHYQAQPDAAETLWYRALLQHTLELIAGMDPADRELVLHDQSSRTVLDAGQRQRLGRLRRRLRRHLSQRFQLSNDGNIEE